MPHQRVKDVAQGWTRDYIQKHKLAKEGDYGPSGVKRGLAPGKRFPKIDKSIPYNNIMKKYATEASSLDESFLTTEGKAYRTITHGPYHPTHADTVVDILKRNNDPELTKKLSHMAYPNKKDYKRSNILDNPNLTGDDKLVTAWTKDSGMIRIRTDQTGLTGIEVNSEPSNTQIRVLKDYVGDKSPDDLIVDYNNDDKLTSLLERRIGLTKQRRLYGHPRGYFANKQRIAYTGGSHYDEAITRLQKDWEGMESSIFKHGCNPGFDENCGLSTDTIIKKLEGYGLDPGDPEETDPDFKEAEMWRENGSYTGPGRERSMAKPHPELPPGDVAHAWVRLDDGTIIDGSSGQFMGEEKGYNPKGENFKSTRNIKHRNRLRIIHPDSKLQKYYEADLDDTEERFYDSVPPGYYDSKQSKSSRIQMARERLGGLTDHDVEISHEGPVTRRKADKPIKKFYEEKHKTYGEDRIKKIREEAELEGMLETGDKRIPLQKVNQPFHSKKPFLRSFTPENAKKLAKVGKADDDDKPFSRKELEKERKNYEESIKRKRRSPTKSELKNRNVRLNKATDYFNKSRKKFDEDISKRDRAGIDKLRESDAIEKEFVNRNRKVNPKKHEGGTTIRNKKRFSKLRQRIGRL